MSGRDPRQSPFVGPRSFEHSEREFFFGRDEEIAILSSLVMTSRASLFYAQSGAGKSSLLRAGLMPELNRQTTIGRGKRASTNPRMFVLPIATVGGGIPLSVGREIANIYVFNTLFALQPDVDPTTLVEQTLAEGLAPFMHVATDSPVAGATDRSDGGHTPRFSQPSTLLVFDQFEQIFASHAERWLDRAGFFQQVREALDAHPRLHVLFTIREDYIAELRPYLNHLDNQLRDRFRLERLKPEPALQAILGPAERAGRAFLSGVAESLVDNLRRMQLSSRDRVSAPAKVVARDGRTQVRSDVKQGAGRDEELLVDLHAVQNETPHLESLLGLYVEPVHLQIVCRQLWENLPPDQLEIRFEDVQEFGDVDQALREFYDVSVNRVVGATTISERRIRTWFGQKLITPSHTRGLVYRDVESETTEGLANDAVDILRDDYIIRADIRGGDTWIELAHDRLVDPILASNTDWFANYFNPLSAPLQAWTAGGRLPAKLLHGELLEQANSFAAKQPEELTDAEREYLAASVRQANTDAELARQRTRRRRIMFLLAVAVFIALSALTTWALDSANKARISQRLADDERLRAASRELAAASLVNLDVDPERSVLLAMHALAITNTLEASSSLHEAVNSSRIEQTLYGHVRPVVGLKYARSGQQIYSAGWDGNVKLWNGATGTEEQAIDTNSDRVNVFEVSNDGLFLITGHEDGSVQIWDTVTGNRRTQLAAHDQPVQGLAFSPDGTTFATASKDMTAKLWNTETGEILHTLRGHRKAVWAVHYHPNGQIIASGGEDGVVKLWDVRSGQEEETLAIHRAGVQDVEFSPDGLLLATASWDYTTKIVELSTSAVLHTLTGHKNWVRGVSFSPDGERVATGSWDRTAKVWDVRSGRELMTLHGHTDWINDVAFSNDGNQLATASADLSVRLWNVGASREVLTYSQHKDGVTSLDIHPQDAVVVSADLGGGVHIWDMFSGETIRTLIGHTGGITDVEYSADGKRIATASEDRSIRIWDYETGDQLMVLTGHRVPVLAVAFSPEGTQFATASADESVKIWNTTDGTERLSIPAHTSRVNGVVFSPDGDEIATVSGDRFIKLWDASSGLEKSAWQAHDLQLRAVDFSPDGQFLATASDDHTAKIWSVESGILLTRMVDHIDRVHDVTFSGNGELVATASWDGTSKVWNLSDGRLRLSLHGHEGRVFDVAFSPDGRYLLSGSEDGTVRAYMLDVDALYDAAKGRVTRSLTPAECATYLHMDSCPELR
jgi:WD40 repeat protein